MLYVFLTPILFDFWIDGERSIMLQKFHHNEYPSPCISIASTTLELLNWIESVVGNGLIKRKT